MLGCSRDTGPIGDLAAPDTIGEWSRETPLSVDQEGEIRYSAAPVSDSVYGADEYDDDGGNEAERKLVSQSTTSIRPNILQLLGENALDGQYLVDREHDRYMRVNPAMCDITGYTDEELLDDAFHVMDIIHPDDRKLIQRLRSRSEEQLTQHVRFRVIKKSGDIRWVDCRARVIRYDARFVSVGSMRDITDQVELEEELGKRMESEQERSREGQVKALEVVSANNRLFQMVESLKGVPELSKRLSALTKTGDVIRQACLYITNRDEGLQFGSCVIYLRRGGFLEVAYSDPFRMTARVRTSEDHPVYAQLLNGETDMVVTEDGKRLFPIHVRDEVTGLLEVGIGKILESIFRVDDHIRRAQESVLKSIADFIGIQISNIELRETMQQQVIEDKLTGLMNRRFFDEKLASEFKRAVRYDRVMALLIFDIDHFKPVNDTHGHAQGDMVLKQVGKLLGKSFRDLDSVCRIGGEEMAVIMPETSLEDAVAKAEQIREAIADLKVDLKASKVEHGPDDTMGVTVSIGVGCVNRSIENEQHLFRETDRALYVAKHSGRNRVCAT